MENGEIADGQISASSHWDYNHAAIQGRLNFKQWGIKQGGWSARSNDLNQWLQVDLGSFTTVAGVATQGRNSYRWIKQWVTSFNVQYSDDGVIFQFYKETWNSSAKVSSYGGEGSIFLNSFYKDPESLSQAWCIPIDTHCRAFSSCTCLRYIPTVRR